MRAMFPFIDAVHHASIEAAQRYSDQNGKGNQSLFDLEKERFQWSQRTFRAASPSGCLFHLRREIKEIDASLNAGNPDPVEFADAQMMLWDTMQRCGISLDEMFQAFRDKFEKNKRRKWNQQPEGHYEHERGIHD